MCPVGAQLLNGDRQTTGGYGNANDRLPQLFFKNPKIKSVSIKLGIIPLTMQLQLRHVSTATGLTES
jgi:hypothetical protein